jgi:DNA repair protein RecO (recombination protein O)
LTHKTRGIILRAVKYGETSLILTLFTEKFGLQSYLVNGVRKQQKTTKTAMLQPASILDLEVYYSESKNLQRIKEYSWAKVYNNLFSDVIRHSIADYIIELMAKSIKQPEHNADLYSFCEDVLLHLDHSSSAVAANMPLFFSLQLAKILGFGLEPPLTSAASTYPKFLDLQEGVFLNEPPEHLVFIEGKNLEILIELLAVMQPDELEAFKLNKDIRRVLLNALEMYYRYHISDFGSLRTIKIMQEVLGV